eukprot:3856771-Amphidinium_carterae.1
MPSGGDHVTTCFCSRVVVQWWQFTARLLGLSRGVMTPREPTLDTADKDVDERDGTVEQKGQQGQHLEPPVREN